MNKDYKIEKTIAKSIKYPVFAWIAGIILKILELSVAGIDIQFPEGVEALQDPTSLFAIAIVIASYDYLKHGKEIKKLP